MECNCTFGIIFLKSGQCMKICFPSIMYFEHPFIWEYNPEANRAECTLKLAGTNKNYNKSDLLKYLRTVEGVSIESETAIINDVNHFIKTNPLMPLYELEKPKKDHTPNLLQLSLRRRPQLASLPILQKIAKVFALRILLIKKIGLLNGAIH